jgi:hypothetical protein
MCSDASRHQAPRTRGLKLDRTFDKTFRWVVVAAFPQELWRLVLIAAILETLRISSGIPDDGY